MGRINNLLTRWRNGSTYTERGIEWHYRQATVERQTANAIYTASRFAAAAMTRGEIRLEGPHKDYWKAALSNTFLFDACRDVFITGNAVYSIGDKRLERASCYEIRGKRRPYRYELEFTYPDATITRKVREDAVLHLMLDPSLERPWEGRSPFIFNDLLANTDKGLLEYSRFPHIRMTPFENLANSDDTSPNDQRRVAEGYRETIHSKAGVYSLPTRGPRDAPKALDHSDYKFMPDEEAVELRKDLVNEAFECLGVPAALRDGTAPGQSVRQEYSRWIQGYLQPICDVLAEQISAALETDVKWDMKPARLPLISDQSSSVANLVKAGIEVDRAMKIVGMDG